MRSVRVTALELCYPASEGRRRITLQTNAADRPASITALLDRHVRREEIERSRLSVSGAELQVELRERGRPRIHRVRLSRDHVGLRPSSPAAPLFACLRLWGLLHGPSA